MASLNLGVIGNCTFGALIDDAARIVWCCLPRFDADPVFCSLIDDDVNARAGFFAIELLGAVGAVQSYRPNTAILETQMVDGAGNRIVVTDFAPRFQTRGRTFRPTTLVRRVRAIGGSPRIRIRVRPRFNYGARAPDVTHGSNHIRYAHTSQALRLNTNAPITYVLDETPFLLEEPVSLLFGPDETLAGGVEETAREFEEKTDTYWRRWTRRLALPFEWQEAVTFTVAFILFDIDRARLVQQSLNLILQPNLIFGEKVETMHSPSRTYVLSTDSRKEYYSEEAYDVGVVQRLRNPRCKEGYLYIVAASHAEGTFGAARYLRSNWKWFAKQKIGTTVGVLLGVDRSNPDNVRILEHYGMDTSDGG